jgi:hypothetical protein
MNKAGRQRRASGKRKHVGFSEVVDGVLGDMHDNTVMVGPDLTSRNRSPRSEESHTPLGRGRARSEKDGE